MAPKLRESVIRLHKTGHMQLAIDSNEDEFKKQVIILTLLCYI